MKAIQEFQEAGGLRRLKELLPVYFDMFQIYAIDAQRDILRTCSLTPTLEGFRVTFLLDQATDS